MGDFKTEFYNTVATKYNNFVEGAKNSIQSAKQWLGSKITPLSGPYKGEPAEVNKVGTKMMSDKNIELQEMKTPANSIHATREPPKGGRPMKPLPTPIKKNQYNPAALMHETHLSQKKQPLH